MAKKSFWQGLKKFFEDDSEHLITDEEWETMQAAQKTQAEAEEADEPQQSAFWRCPECHMPNEQERLFCARCGFHPGSFRDILPQMTTEQLELVLGGSCRYPAAELRLLERELARRTAGPAAKPAAAKPAAAEDAPIDPAELERLTQVYRDKPAAALYAIVTDGEYTPEARGAARAELRRQGLPETPSSAPGAPGADAQAPAEQPQGWKCVRCGACNPEEEYFCKACGDYRY